MPAENKDLYGNDPIGTAQKEANRVLGVPDPTLDIWGETDGRAASEGNHGVQPSGSQPTKKGGKF